MDTQKLHSFSPFQTTALVVAGAGAVGLGLAEIVTYARQQTNLDTITANRDQITSNAANANTLCNSLQGMGSQAAIATAITAISPAVYNQLAAAVNGVINAAQTCSAFTG